MLSAPGVAAAQLSETPILFQTTRDGTSDIYAMDPNGRRQTPVIAQGSDDEDPDWAPDATRFAFTSDRTGSWQIFVMPVGGDPTPLTDEPGANVDPQWSPRGDQIAFTNASNFHIYVMSPSGGSVRELTDGWQDEAPTWSPNGRIVQFFRTARGSGRAQIWQVDLTGRNLRRLATPVDASDPAWGPVLP